MDETYKTSDAGIVCELFFIDFSRDGHPVTLLGYVIVAAWTIELVALALGIIANYIPVDGWKNRFRYLSGAFDFFFFLVHARLTKSYYV